MKFQYLCLSLCLLASCSWKQKEFKDMLDSDTETQAPQVEASQEILQKFEVEETKTVTTPAPVAVPVKKETTNKKVEKALQNAEKSVNNGKAATAATPITPPEKPASKIPADYPPEVAAISKTAEATWKKYKPQHLTGQKSYLDIHYLGMTVGKIMITNKGLKTINGKEVWHFHARFKSAPFYSSIYELDDTVDTYVAKENFLSVRYSLIQRESKQNVDDLQLFDRDALKTMWFYKMVRPDKTKVKNEEHPLPAFSSDPFSVLFLFQGLPLKDGDHYEIPIINKGKILILKSDVEGREVIDTELGKKKAVRLHAVTKYSGDHLKSGDMTFWFSDDENKTLLKASAKIKIGSVTADVVDAK